VGGFGGKRGGGGRVSGWMGVITNSSLQWLPQHDFSNSRLY